MTMLEPDYEAMTSRDRAFWHAVEAIRLQDEPIDTTAYRTNGRTVHGPGPKTRDLQQRHQHTARRIMWSLR